MWFDNPFRSNDPGNLSLLLKNLGGLQEQEKKYSSTVDVWKGNYDDFVERKPKITIIKKYPDPVTELAEVKTLQPEIVAPTARTLLCHHATGTSGHHKCSFPGKCSQHRLQKPSAFELSKLDKCRTVIDLYEQGVMSGVINAEQRISRDSSNQRYENVELKEDCRTHLSGCKGGCRTHSNEIIVEKAKPVTTTERSKTQGPTRFDISKQVVVLKTPERPNSAAPRLQTYDCGEDYKQLSKIKNENRGSVRKKVTFSDQVLVKCVNANCGKLSVTGEPCHSTQPQSCQKEAQKSITDGKQCNHCRQQINDKNKIPEGVVCKNHQQNLDCGTMVYNICEENKCKTTYPSCYFEHARNRMRRLKEKSEELKERERIYAPPSSLATPNSVSLIKKYNSAKQKCLRRKKFVIPNVDADCLYQPTKPGHSRKCKRPKSAPAKNSITAKKPPAPCIATPKYQLLEYSTPTARPSLRNMYPRKVYDPTENLLSSNRKYQVKRKPKFSNEIPIAVDDDGPLVFMVDKGKIKRMPITHKLCY